MARRLFYRNIQAGEQLETFFVSAVASLLLVRFYLYITGFPQLGSGGLHIAHMLWGGILMLASIVLMISFLGNGAQRFAAVAGGAGFGIFIDEIGKFVTSDNNYFFRPAVGIIYAIFVGLYLIFNFLGRREQHLSSREYQLNALKHIEEAIRSDLDTTEKRRAQSLLARADPKSVITQQLQELLTQVNTVRPGRPSRMRRWLSGIDAAYAAYWNKRESVGVVRGIFIAEALLFLIGVAVAVYTNVDEVLDVFNGRASYSRFLLIGQLLSSLFAALFVALGALRLGRSRQMAFEQFRRATLINLLLTEFFSFSREQFAALPGFVFSLLLLMLISFVLRQEHSAAAD